MKRQAIYLYALLIFLFTGVAENSHAQPKMGGTVTSELTVGGKVKPPVPKCTVEFANNGVYKFSDVYAYNLKNNRNGPIQAIENSLTVKCNTKVSLNISANDMNRLPSEKHLKTDRFTLGVIDGRLIGWYEIKIKNGTAGRGKDRVDFYRNNLEAAQQISLSPEPVYWNTLGARFSANIQVELYLTKPVYHFTSGQVMNIDGSATLNLSYSI